MDPAFSGGADSKFGIVAIAAKDSKLRVLEAAQYSGLSNTDSLLKVEDLLKRLEWYPGCRFISDLKLFQDSYPI